MSRHAVATVAVLSLCVAAGAATTITDPALRDASTLELTTTGRKSGQPRTVKIWFVYDDRLYVQSGQEGKTDWYRNVLAAPAVMVRIGDREWRGTARAVDDPAEI